MEAKLDDIIFKERELVIDLGPITQPYLKGEIKGLENRMIMWMIGSLITLSILIFTVLNQRVNDINQRITLVETSLNKRMDSIEKDIAENRVFIQENKILIQKVLDNQNQSR